MMKRGVVFGFLLFVTGLVIGMVLTGRTRSATESTATPLVAAASQLAPQVVAATSNLPDFSDVAAGTVSSVTNISSLQLVRRTSPFSRDPFFRYFFGDSSDLFGLQQRPSLGSGVIVSPDGYILTNAHVVGQRMAEITVTLADEREMDATLVGIDESTDIALLKVEALGLPAIAWGDSSRLKVAEWVLAIGNPFQLSQTVTLGIVSAVGRDNLGVATYEDFIQTDAAINPGNSGGALINARGELIGINTAILSESGGSQGVGFAVPSNLARRVMQDLIAYGEVRRGSIGYVDTRSLTPRLAQRLGLPNRGGAVVWEMSRRSAAYQAGIEPGDVIVRLNGQPVPDNAAFVRLLSDAPIGSTVTLGVLRQDREIEVDVRVSQDQGQRRR